MPMKYCAENPISQDKLHPSIYSNVLKQHGSSHSGCTLGSRLFMFTQAFVLPLLSYLSLSLHLL